MVESLVSAERTFTFMFHKLTFERLPVGPEVHDNVDLNNWSDIKPLEGDSNRDNWQDDDDVLGGNCLNDDGRKSLQHFDGDLYESLLHISLHDNDVSSRFSKLV